MVEELTAVLYKIAQALNNIEITLVFIMIVIILKNMGRK